MPELRRLKLTSSTSTTCLCLYRLRQRRSSKNFNALVSFLKINYWKIKVISGGLLTELEKCKKPADNDFQEKAESILAIVNVILRIQNLKTKLPEEQVDKLKSQGSSPGPR